MTKFNGFMQERNTQKREMFVLINLQSKDSESMMIGGPIDDGLLKVGQWISTIGCRIVEKVTEEELYKVLSDKPPKNLKVVVLPDKGGVSFYEIMEDGEPDPVGCVEVHKCLI